MNASALLLVLALACGSSSTGPEAPDGAGVSIELEPDSTTLVEGDTTTLDAEVEGSDGGAPPPVSWSTSAPSVARVSGTGLISAVFPGAAMITASIDGAEDTVTVEVRAPQPAAEPVVVEEFSSYSSTSELLNDPRGIYTGVPVNTDRIALDTSVGVSELGLSQSMRYDYGDGVGTITLKPDIPGGANEVWIEVWVRFSTNFRTDWGKSGNPDFKFIMATTDPGRFELKTGMFGSDYSVGAPQNPSIDTDPSSAQDWDGEWHRYRMHFRHESSDGACDGTTEAWIDGDRHLGSVGDVCTNRSFGEMFQVALGANMNQVPSEPIELWWGRFALWTSDPGW